MQFLPRYTLEAYRAGKNTKPLDRQQKACFLPVWGTDEIQGTKVEIPLAFLARKIQVDFAPSHSLALLLRALISPHNQQTDGFSG